MWNQKCQNQQTCTHAVRGIHSTLLRTDWETVGNRVCECFLSRTHHITYTHKTDIFSICCHAAIHKNGDNQAQNSARTSTHKMHFIAVFLYRQSLCIRTHKNYTQFLTLSTIPHSHPLTKNVQKDTPTQTKHAQDFPVRDGFKRRIGEFFESFQETPHPLFLVTLNCLFAMERDFLPRHYMEYYTENNVISSTKNSGSHYKQSIFEHSDSEFVRKLKWLVQSMTVTAYFLGIKKTKKQCLKKNL